MKTAELKDELLDYWVAKAEEIEGIELGLDGKFHGSICRADESGEDWYLYSPSTNPAQAYPIIEREKIDTYFDRELFLENIKADEAYLWSARHYNTDKDHDWKGTKQHGPSLLIAAMRCFVASKFGEEVNDCQAHPV